MRVDLLSVKSVEIGLKGRPTRSTKKCVERQKKTVSLDKLSKKRVNRELNTPIEMFGTVLES